MIIKSQEFQFIISLPSVNFDEACKKAYRQALRELDIGDSGHSKFETNFPRSESNLKIDFIGFSMTGSMVGGENLYTFNTYLEKESDENEEQELSKSLQDNRIKMKKISELSTSEKIQGVILIGVMIWGIILIS